MNLRAVLYVSIVLVGDAFMASCSATACEQWQSWRNGGTSACQSCQSTNCSMELTRTLNVATQCEYDFACAARCPHGSATSCGCIEMCLTTTMPNCKMAYEALYTCAVSQCTSSCH